jgi:SAM-dependent methyltransferase
VTVRGATWFGTMTGRNDHVRPTQDTSIAAFEERYRTEGDPWGTLSDPSEQEKAAATLEACGDGPFERVCDLGTGIGVLAAALAPRSSALIALDGAPTAVAQAIRRLAPWPHARAQVAVLPGDLPAGRFDLVVASELLYYLSPSDLETTLDWLERALLPGGRVVAVHWTGSALDMRQSGHDVHARLAARPALEHVDGRRGETYRLDVLTRRR